MNQEEIRHEKCVQAHPGMVVNVIQAVFCDGNVTSLF